MYAACLWMTPWWYRDFRQSGSMPRRTPLPPELGRRPFTVTKGHELGLGEGRLRDSGQWLSDSDFVWRQQRVVAEFDGDHHRTDRAQWAE